MLTFLEEKWVKEQYRKSLQGDNMKNVGLELIGEKDKIIGLVCEDQEGLEYVVYVPVIDELVNRFLCWKLPKDFMPDCGISFKRDFNEGTDFPMQHEPVGTNLFTAPQAKEMFEYLLRVK